MIIDGKNSDVDVAMSELKQFVQENVKIIRILKSKIGILKLLQQQKIAIKSAVDAVWYVLLFHNYSFYHKFIHLFMKIS